MSEVIEAYIRRHPELSEKEAFDGFLKEDRIKAWVGTDDARRERLRREFGRVWGSLHVAGLLSGGEAARGAPAAAAQAPAGARAVRVQHAAPQAPAQVVGGAPQDVALARPSRSVPNVGAGRRLQVLCTQCKRIEVWMDDEQGIACRHCGREYDDMLSLIRVTPVGPFEFLFGEGWKGAAVAGGIVAGLAGAYFLLRGF